jgi:hypothetical protein
MATPKKPKPKPLPVTTETIGKAADTNAIKALVALGDAFNRVALHGPFATELPMFCSTFVGGEKQQYRKHSIPIGTRFMPDKISMGKKQGLIFSFTPEGQLQREGHPIDRAEIGWDDVINHFGDLADKIEERLNRNREQAILVESIDTQIKAVIAKNPSMHKILTEGFALAQVHSKQAANDDSMEEIPGFGMF